MPLGIYVDAYSCYKPDERPRQFNVDKDIYEIEMVEDQWRTPDAAFFKVRSIDGKHYLLRNDEPRDEWTLQSDFDGSELLARTSIELVAVGSASIRKAESQITGCVRCRPENSEILFDSILSDVLGKHGAYEFVLTESGRGPNCRGEISEKTLVESTGGIQVEDPIKS